MTRHCRMRHLPASTPHAWKHYAAPFVALFAVQQNLIAAKAYLNAGYSHGCRDPICLKWLSLCLLSAGETHLARVRSWTNGNRSNRVILKLTSCWRLSSSQRLRLPIQRGGSTPRPRVALRSRL